MFIVLSENNIYGYVILGFMLLGLAVFLLQYIPRAQRLEITSNGIVLYSYKICRTFFWSEIKGVLLNEISEDDVKIKQIVLQIFQSGSNRTRLESHINIPLDATIYGYTPEELYDLISKKISQPPSPADTGKAAVLKS